MPTDRSSLSLPLALALGVGALLGISAASQRKHLENIVGPRANLEGANPLPLLEIVLGAGLAQAGGRLRETVGQVPQAIRDNLGFGPSGIQFIEEVGQEEHGYTLRLRGLAVGKGKVYPDRLLALRTLGDGGGDLAGEIFRDPVTGRTGVWIPDSDAGQARLLGYDVLEPGFVMALDVDTLIRRHLHELLTREETYRLLDRARQTAPKTVEELMGKTDVGTIQAVLRALLREQVCLRDLPLVLELLADAVRDSKEPVALTEAVRRGMARQLSASLASDDGVLHVLPLGGRWENLRGARQGDGVVRETVLELRRILDQSRDHGVRPVLIAPSDLRWHVRQLFERDLPDLPVLAEHEVDPSCRIETMGTPSLVGRG